MAQLTKNEDFKGIYSLHVGGLIEFTFSPLHPGDQRAHIVKCNYDDKNYRFIMLPDIEKGNYIIHEKEHLPDIITDLEEDLSETIFNQYN